VGKAQRAHHSWLGADGGHGAKSVFAHPTSFETAKTPLGWGALPAYQIL